ncbi:MAG: energy transducer TonB [Verrucomicrobia bacterium]|nr:energy transducer TonB [Verrucomicrobiota bacterium]
MKRYLLLCLVALSLGLAGCQTAAPSEGQPRPRIRVAPVYPRELRLLGISGEAVVEFTVEANGDVVNPVVIRATKEAFGQAAAACIVRWKYDPAVKDGQPVASVQRQTITFIVN